MHQCTPFAMTHVMPRIFTTKVKNVGLGITTRQSDIFVSNNPNQSVATELQLKTYIFITFNKKAVTKHYLKQMQQLHHVILEIMCILYFSSDFCRSCAWYIVSSQVVSFHLNGGELIAREYKVLRKHIINQMKCMPSHLSYPFSTIGHLSKSCIFRK